LTVLQAKTVALNKCGAQSESIIKLTCHWIE